MPGSGPIDPETIWNAVHNGATYANGTLDGQHLFVTTTNAWALTTSAGCTLSQRAYEALASGAVRSKLIWIGSTSYQLAPVNGVAELAAP